MLRSGKRYAILEKQRDKITVYGEISNLDNVVVNFYEIVEDELLKFAIIIAKYNNKWVVCKYKEHNTFEVPGGRRE